MNVNIFLRENLKGIHGSMHVAPEIPEKKLNNAVTAFKFKGSPGTVIAIWDSTLFGSAKEGLLMTGETIYYRMYGREFSCPWSEIKEIKSIEIIKDAEKNKKEKAIRIEKKDESKFDFSLIPDSIHDRLAEILQQVIGDDASHSEEEQNIPIERMPEELKLAYGKIVVNMAYHNDNQVDEKELSEILLLMTRINLKSEYRVKLRSYITDRDSIETEESLISCLDENSPPGQIKSVHVSLVKDLLNVHLSTNGNDINDFDFLNKNRKLFDVSDDQINLALETIKVDRQLLNEHVTDDQMTKMVKDLATKAASVGVPMAAVYLSGSVIGLSATGITSGLATLGMGGILGMSGMVTGIGVVVLLGVGAYAGMNKFTGADEIAKSKRRELMLTEVVKQTQKTISDFMEDMNYVVNKLNELIRNDSAKGEEIRKLSALLTKLSSAGNVLTQRSESAQGGISRIHCAQNLNKEKLAQLTRDPTKKDFYEYILGHYETSKINCNNTPQEKTADSTELTKAVEINTTLTLKEGLSARELEDLAEAFEMIGYFKVGNVIAGKLSGIFN